MNRSKKITLSIYFIAFALPILGMMNCSGWDEGSMTVESCMIDGAIFRAYADFYYGWLLISAFMVGAPILLFIGIVVFLTKLITKRIDKTEQ
jgi:hypothetical protein